MPTDDIPADDHRQRPEARVRPDAATVLHARAMLAEIDRRVFAGTRPFSEAGLAQALTASLTRLLGHG